MNDITPETDRPAHRDSVPVKVFIITWSMPGNNMGDPGTNGVVHQVFATEALAQAFIDDPANRLDWYKRAGEISPHAVDLVGGLTECVAEALRRAATEMPAASGFTTSYWDSVEVRYDTYETSPNDLTPQTWLRRRANELGPVGNRLLDGLEEILSEHELALGNREHAGVADRKAFEKISALVADARNDYQEV